MPLDVLICGGGIGGPALAFWLSHAGHRVTIVERFPVLRASGAQIDLRAQGIQVAKRMGIIDAVRAKCVDEDGVQWLNQNGRVAATFLANKSGKGAQTFSSEYEIMRGDLVQVLHDATADRVKYIFGMSVDTFEQDDKKVTVHFSDGTSSKYDILVGADGQGSRIRKAILPAGTDPLRHLGIFTTHWRVPTIATDDKLGRLCHVPGGRMVMTRTHSPTVSQAALMIRESSEEWRSMPKASVETQKQFWASKFKDVGWAAPRLIAEMDASDYFYCHEIVQVKTETWSKGRVVIMADAAHCPSPMTGCGTTSALVGAYVLAGEILKTPDDLDKAFANYDKTLRPFVNELQKLPGWIVSIFLPRSWLAIWILHSLLRLICFLRIPQLAVKFSKEERAGWMLPEYEEMDKITTSLNCAS